MQKEKKVIKLFTLLSLFTFILSMLVGLTFIKGNNLVAHADVEHNHSSWTAWSNSNSLPTSAGSYYLTTDVTLTQEWGITSGTYNLCLNGHGITQTQEDRVIHITGGTLNLYDCGETVHYFDIENKMAINVNTTEGEGRESFTGGYITGGHGVGANMGANFYSSGGGVLLEGGLFNMYGGTILGCQASEAFGGGAEVIKGTMSILGGTIMYNKGSGVNVRSNGENGNVSNYLVEAIINNANICYNTMAGVGNHYCYGYAKTTIKNSNIHHNNGNGVQLEPWEASNNNVLRIEDSQIEDNDDWGIRANDKADVILSGDVIIKRNGDGGVNYGKTFTLDNEGSYIIQENGYQNKNYPNCNVKVPINELIIIGGSLQASTLIGVSMQFTGVFTEENTENFIELFTADDPLTKVVPDEETRGLKIVKHYHDLEYTVDGATITATCKVSTCPITEGLSLTILAPQGELIANGTSYWCTFAEGYDKSVFPDIHDYDIEYYLNGEKVQSCKEVGTYTATIEVEDVKASLQFVIRPEHHHDFEYTVDGATITATCKAEDCPITEGLTLSLVAPQGNLIADGTSYKCTLTEGFSEVVFPGVSSESIKYYLKEEQVQSCEAVGTYTASVEFEDKTISLEFTIRPEHEHSYSTEWSSDDDNHWHACTVENCPEPKKDTAVHTFGTEGVTRYTCTVCEHIDNELKAQVNAYDREKEAERNAEENKPANLEGMFGDKLSAIVLGGNYSWVNPNIVLGELGIHTFNIKYDDGTYEFEFEVSITVKPRVIVDTESGVSVKISNSEESLDPNVTLEIEVKTSVVAQESESEADFKAIKEKLEANEIITKVYDVKLIRTIDGVSTEIQPSDIKPGTVITIMMTIPEEIANQEFKILHIHSNNDIEFITNFTKNGNEISFETDRLSEFAYVIKLPAPAKVRHGFCVGVVLMILSILLYLYVVLFVIIRFGFFKELVAKVKLDKLYDKVTLLEYIAMYASGAMFLFSLISLVLHQCGFTIVFFILNFLVCAGAVFLFLADQQIIKLSFKRKAKEE